MKVVGLCRFSVFGQPGRADPADGRLEVASLEEALARLWHPVRMAQRFHLLETLLLPSLKAQTDSGAEILLLASASMPDLFQARLDAVTAAVPGLRLIRTEAADEDAALFKRMEEASAGFSAPVAYFQVGEDQGLTAEYTARLRDAAMRVDPGGVVSFPTGVFGFHNGGLVRHGMMEASVVVAGVMPPVPPEVTFDQWLSRDTGRVPVFTDPTFAAYHRTQLFTPTTEAYQALFPVSGIVRRRVLKYIEQDPELAAGAVITRKAEAAIATAFPHLSAGALREAISAAWDPVALAEAMGFPLEPLAG